jgi:hypothetical protein
MLTVSAWTCCTIKLSMTKLMTPITLSIELTAIIRAVGTVVIVGIIERSCDPSTTIVAASKVPVHVCVISRRNTLIAFDKTVLYLLLRVC